MSNDCENICITIDGKDEEEDTRFKLIPFEQNLMVENFISDVLYIMARLNTLTYWKLDRNLCFIFVDQSA